jgi:hypothetical protein
MKKEEERKAKKRTRKSLPHKTHKQDPTTQKER